MQTLKRTITSLDIFDVLQSLELAHEDVSQCCLKGRCSAYLGLPDVETFSKIKLRFKGRFSHVYPIVSTGKFLDTKFTKVLVTNKQEDHLLFGFHNHKINFLINGVEQEIDCTPTDGTQAYENVLESLYSGNYDLFISPDIAQEALRIVTPVLKRNLQINPYEAGSNASWAQF